MINASAVFAIADSHFTYHLLAPGEADAPFEKAPGAASPEGREAPSGQGSAGEAAASGVADARSEEYGTDAQGASMLSPEAMAILPENLVEDFLDEAIDMLEEIGSLYEDRPGWERALVYGFIDGALAVADDTWTSFEDTYFQDSDNPDLERVDSSIDRIADDFDGSRPWDEAAKGYVRAIAADVEEGSESGTETLWLPCAHAFFYGAEASYDLEWKFVITPAGNIVLTDEDSISEAVLAQMTADSGSGSLIDRVFDMMGINLDELAGAIGPDIDDEDAEPVEAEIVDVEDAESAEVEDADGGER